VIKVFDSLTDTTPVVFADLNVNVYNFWDRGLLGLALHPNFPTNPSVYVLYTYDHELGSSAPAPRWGTPGVYSDPCPTPPGATGDGCVVSGRLSRLQASGNTMTGAEQVLVEDWCQQYPSHSVGTVEFGADGSLYASGGDGASFEYVDYGQTGSPLNPCGDPPGGVGATLTAPTAEGGALRSQDLRTPSDPVSLDGTIIRVDPATGAGLPNNPSPAAPTPTPGGLSRTGCATRSASRPAPAPPSCGWATSAGATGRRSTASPTRWARSRTSAGPATRDPGAKGTTTS
jgi:glucose/arabinose dehydrogenase